MNRKTIEILAVNTVRESIAVCDYMEPFLNENDKTPSWDGEIIIYSKSDKKKENLRGCIKAQIKGTNQSDLTKEVISYSVSVVDLKNFQRSGGTIYFVVYVSPNKIDKQIYYNDLSPVKLKHYIDSAKGKTIKIPFKRFPNDVTMKTDICINLHDEGVKQIGSIEHILSIDDLQTRNIKKIDFSYTSFAETAPNIIQYVLNNAVGMYVQLEGSNISYPLDNTELRLHIEHQQQTVVKIGETIFYSKVNIKQTAGELIIRIGDSLDIIHYKDTKQIKFNYRLSKSLRKAVVDLAFMNATMDAKGFCVNNTWYNIPDEIVNSYNREWGLTAIASMTEFVKVLDILNIEKDIEWEKLSKQEYSDLNTLVNVFLRNEFVYDLDDALSPVCVMEIQGIKLLLGVVRSEKFADAWEIYNVFEYPTRKDVQYRRTEDGAILPTSIYTMLNPEDYSMIDNINYETLPDTYKCLKDSNPMLVEIINRDLLIMLLAYDKHPNERLLLAVESLAKWILDDDSLPEFLYELCFINLMQVYKRKRNLTDEEKDAIYDIYETATQYDMRTASALLLDDYIGARRNYSKMEGNMQEYFKTLPIYRFWKSN